MPSRSAVLAAMASLALVPSVSVAHAGGGNSSTDLTTVRTSCEYVAPPANACLVVDQMKTQLYVYSGHESDQFEPVWLPCADCVGYGRVGSKIIWRPYDTGTRILSGYMTVKFGKGRYASVLTRNFGPLSLGAHNLRADKLFLDGDGLKRRRGFLMDAFFVVHVPGVPMPPNTGING